MTTREELDTLIEDYGVACVEVEDPQCSTSTIGPERSAVGHALDALFADLAALREAVRCARDYMHTDRCDVHLAPPPGVACLACVRECSALVEMAEAVGQALGPEDAARAKVTL